MWMAPNTKAVVTILNVSCLIGHEQARVVGVQCGSVVRALTYMCWWHVSPASWDDEKLNLFKGHYYRVNPGLQAPVIERMPVA